MKAPDFWWSSSTTLSAALLSPVSWIYGWISARKMHSKPKGESRLPVVCIGNFVVGGTGKTPFSLMLAELLKNEGLRPGFLLRGYGGSEQGPLLINPDDHVARQVGDEALMLARSGPTIISSDRVAGSRFAEKQEIDVLLMDDGFQNPALKKDLSFVLVDAAYGLGNGKCLPSGPLRAPMSAQIVATDVLVVVGEGQQAEPAIKLASRKGIPIIYARLEPGYVDDLKNGSLYAFAGIGRPEKFYDTLRALKLDVAETLSFPDHHEFSEAEAQKLLELSEQRHLQLVTTEKDMVRIETARPEIFRWLATRTEVLPVYMRVPDGERLSHIVQERINKRRYELGR
ncbi:tetraacyldisaccharide 4'-kinase [Roseibium sp. TrichSKD4]|uniref:tetraacyldisaccharide 4'-kinase n=1 Tax=Roseibium sp. TrichSKD4 TaxID=744980 RepID=UPI0001E56276|nr:tetraacyldisaccharide 4'-kinase [Roseibium sp. TrichSKD4]EFO34488.1 tetraacyldisaccharide 4'-kinase [Roseibium sp. TrichSKD4]